MSLPRTLPDWLYATFELGRPLGAGIAGIALASILVLTLRLVLAEEDRRLVRAPLVLLVLHVIAWLGKLASPSGSTAERLLSLSALFFLLASLGRSAFLLLIHVVLARRLATSLPRIVQDIIQIGVYSLVGLVTLRAAGVEPGSLLATSALLTAVVGLSLQDTLGNMFAGLAIQAERPFQVGDWIQFDEKEEHVGKVMEINWRATRLVTLDLVELTVPNNVLAKAALSNFSRPRRLARRSVYVVAPYSIPPGRVRRLLIEVAASVPGVVSTPGPSALVLDFTERGVKYWVRYFLHDFQRRQEIAGEIRQRIWYALSREQVDIPPPLRHVELHQLTAEADQRSREEAALARYERLAQVEILKPLSEPLMKRLAALAELRLYAEGEFIIRQGDAGEELFIVAAGRVRVLVQRDGADHEVAELDAGKFFGEMSLMTGAPRAASVQTKTECQVIVVGKTAFHQIIEQNPNVLADISAILAERYDDLDEASESDPSGERKTEPQAVLLDKIKQFFSVK